MPNTKRPTDLARLYTNENVPLELVKLLRQLGHDCQTSFESGRANQSIPDVAVLQYGFETSRIVVTNNRRDFIRLHRQNANHSGVIVFTHDANLSALAERINEALNSAGGALNQRFLIRIDKSGYRIDPA